MPDLGAQQVEVGPGIEQVPAVEQDLAGRALVRVERIHPVERSQQRRLAAAGRTDEGRHVALGDVEADAASGPGTRRSRSPGCGSTSWAALRPLHRRQPGRRPRLRRALRSGGSWRFRVAVSAYRGWRNTVRARMFRISTDSVISSAAAHARAFQSSKGLIANWKITTGRFAIGPFMSVLQNWLLRAVNSSGAVSPEIRATASSTPVITPPRTALQRDHQDHLPHRRAQRHGGLAQAGGHEPQHVLGGAHDHGDGDQRQRHRARPSREMADVQHVDRVDEQADDDRRRRQQDVVDEAGRARPAGCCARIRRDRCRRGSRWAC